MFVGRLFYHDRDSRRDQRRVSYRKSREKYRHFPRERELKPVPINGKCNPLCPFFRCGKGALTIKPGKGGSIKAFCRWVNDDCIGYKCQFAYCFRRALLPDGTCTLARPRKMEQDETDIISEASRDEWSENVRRILSKRLGRRFMDELD